MTEIGYQSMKEEDVKKLMGEADLNNNSQIDFIEFIKMMKKFKDTGRETQFTKIVTKTG